MNLPIITGHSGGEGTARDSMESIYRVLECKAEAIEVDIRMDSKGVFRVSHDRKESDDEYERCVTLAEVFKFVAPTHLKVNLDIKESEHTHAILCFSEQYEFHKDRLIISGGTTPEQLAREPSICDRATVLLNIEEIFKYLYMRQMMTRNLKNFPKLINEPWTFTRPWMAHLDEHLDDVIAMCKVLKVAGLNTPHWFINEAIFAKLAKAEIPLSIWTVDDPDMAEQFLGYKKTSLFNLTTRQVRKVQAARMKILGF